MVLAAMVAMGVVSWAAVTIYLDRLWRRRREVWMLQLHGRVLADEAWEWLNSR